MSLDVARIDTICALSSGTVSGAIAIVRASGKDALVVLQKIFRRRSEIMPLVAMHGEIINHVGEVVDDVVAVFYPSHQGFTGEPSCEIFCHGNHIIIQEILEAMCHHGARLALPGEFSLRAFLNGKIDLAQAESIADLIHAKSVAAKKVALRGVQGGLEQKTAPLRELIISALAEIEARMDFPDEDLGGYDRAHLVGMINEAITALSGLLCNAAFALKLHEGMRVVICGVPNAGKSTLLNRLCGEERAIVHETAGTTRDVLEAHITLGGVPVVLVDVAGIRHVDEADHVERIGISKAHIELKRAHLVIWLADCTTADPFGDACLSEALASIDAPIMHVLNKAELLVELRRDYLCISAQTGLGMSDFLAHLTHLIVGDAQQGEMFITRARQKEELETALAHLGEARAALVDRYADEVVTSELRGAGLAFDRLFGTEMCEEVLDRIFSRFCIGK